LTLRKGLDLDLNLDQDFPRGEKSVPGSHAGSVQSLDKKAHGK
jgi:hypothetical protein